LHPVAKAGVQRRESLGEHDFECRDFDNGGVAEMVLEAREASVDGEAGVELRYDNEVSFPIIPMESWERLLVGGTIIVRMGDNRTMIRMHNAPGAE